MASKAFEIDLDRIQKRATAAIEAKAEQDRQAEQARVDAEAARKDAIRARQTELNAALGAAGLPLIAVDGIVGPQTRQAELDVSALGPPEDSSTPSNPADLFSDQDNYPGLRAQPQTTNDEGHPEVWGIYKNAQGEWDWEIIGTQVNDEFVPIGQSPGKGGGGGGGAGGGKGNAWEEELRKLSAEGALRSYLKSFGLEKISDWAYAQLSSGYNVDTIAMQMRYGSSTVAVDNDMYVPDIVRTTYDKRFPAMALRDTDDKTAPLTEAEYIDLESGYWQIIDAAGMGAYADTAIASGVDLITELIVGDVSPAEFQGRLVEAEEIAFNTNPEVQAALTDKWGWGKGEFITAMFDPDNITLKEAKRTRRAATLSGTAHRALGGTAGGSELAFSKQLGLDLLALDVQGREVQSQMGALSGLTQSTMHSGSLTADQLGEGVWGSGKARASMRRTVEGRQAGFSGKSGALTTAGGTTSLGTTNT